MPPKKKRVFKDDLKDDLQRESDRAGIIETVEAVLDRVLQKDSVWHEPDFENIRSMICQIGNDKARFPPLLAKL